MLLVGTGKEKWNSDRDLGKRFLGYASGGRFIRRKETDMYVRAIWIKQNEHSICFLHFELFAVSKQLKSAILQFFADKAWKRFNITSKNLIVSAQNTHSAPGGMFKDELMQFGSEPYDEEFTKHLAKVAVDAASKAVSKLHQAQVKYAIKNIETDKDVAFNRNFEAYNLNTDVEPIDDQSTEIGVNRLFRLLKFTDAQGTVLASLSWLGLHGNSISADNDSLHSDNKGYAASLLEQYSSIDNDFVTLFCCEAGADVSPNFHGSSAKKWWPRGRYDDNFKSAYFNGFIQYDEAKTLIDTEEHDIELKLNELNLYYSVPDFENLSISERYTNSGKIEKTGFAALGISVLKGNSVDGAGLDPFTYSLVKVLKQIRAKAALLPLINRKTKRARKKAEAKAHHPKQILISNSEPFWKSVKKVAALPVVNNFNDEVTEFKNRVSEHKIPKMLDGKTELQMLKLGELVIVFFPGDITVTASNRLRSRLLQEFENRNQPVVDIIIQAYTNDFAGYCTTEEEYQSESFEAGFTLFGRNTLAAFTQEYCKLFEQHAHKNR